MAGFQPWEAPCIEIAFHFKLFGIPLVIVIAVCLDSGSAPTSSQVDAVASACDQWMTFDMLGVLSEDLAYQSVTATQKNVSTGYQKVIDHGGGIFGSIASHSVPSQLAIVCTLYTALRGRNYRGRTFIPGVPINYINTGVNSNEIAPGDVTALLTAYNAIDARLASVSAHQEVISRVLAKVERPVAQGNRVTTRAMDVTFDTIRRRGANAHRS